MLIQQIRLFLVLIFLISELFPLPTSVIQYRNNQELQCSSKNSSCYACRSMYLLNKKCEWYNSQCIDDIPSAEIPPEEKWYDSFSLCFFDETSSQWSKQYEMLLQPSTKSQTFSLKKQGNLYNPANYFGYSILSLDNEDIEIIYTKNNSITNLNMKWSIRFTHSSSGSNDEWIKEFTESTNFKLEKVTTITIYIYSEFENTQQPFTMQLNTSYKRPYLHILIPCVICGLFLLVIIICITLLIIFHRKRLNQIYQRSLGYIIQKPNYESLENPNDVAGEYNRNNYNWIYPSVSVAQGNNYRRDETRKDETQWPNSFGEQWTSSDIIPNYYAINYNLFNMNCSICWSKFRKRSKVTMITCKHLYHYECLLIVVNMMNDPSMGLNRGDKALKCPNCNLIIKRENIVRDIPGFLNITQWMLLYNNNLMISPVNIQVHTHGSVSLVNQYSNIENSNAPPVQINDNENNKC